MYPRRFPVIDLKLDLRSMREALARMKRGELFKPRSRSS